MFSELDRSGIRWALGYSAIFLQADPSLENAITAIQSVADLGARPDSTEENFCKGCLYGFALVAGPQVVPNGAAQNTTFGMPSRKGILAVWSDLDVLDLFLGALEAENEVKVDQVREQQRLLSKGRRLVNALASKLSTAIVVDIFGSFKLEPGGNAYHYNRPQTAWSAFHSLQQAQRGLW